MQKRVGSAQRLTHYYVKRLRNKQEIIISDVQRENGSSEIAKKVCKLLKKEGMLAKKVTA